MERSVGFARRGRYYMEVILSVIVALVSSSTAQDYGHRIGSLTTRGDRVTGDVYALDSRTILVKNYQQNGAGPAVLFWTGTSGGPSILRLMNAKNFIQGSDGRGGDWTEVTGRLPAHRFQPIDVVVQLTAPGEVEIRNLAWISAWCVRFSANLGDLIGTFGAIPDPVTPTSDAQAILNSLPAEGQLTHCVSLQRANINLLLKVSDDDLEFTLQSNALPNQYVAFGISGDSSRAQMVGADVVVTYIDNNGQPQAIDYYLPSRQQCAQTNKNAVCSDTDQGGTNNVELISGKREEGVTTIVFKRPRRAVDVAYDKPFATDGSTQIVWAKGSLADDGTTVTYHGIDRTSSSLAINLDDVRSVGCSPIQPIKDPTQKCDDAWTARCIDDSNEFLVQYGPSGGRKGYQCTTGLSASWGIAYFINGLLIPQIYVQRGKTYTFKIQSSDQHPLYIAVNDERGGLEQNPDGSSVKVLAGLTKNGGGGYSVPDSALGGDCQYEFSVEAMREFDSFDEFRQNLELNCESDVKTGTISWTPDANTPNEVYYQCYRHYYLGWKIKVVDGDTAGLCKSHPNSASTVLLAHSTVVLISITTLLLIIFQSG